MQIRHLLSYCELLANVGESSASIQLKLFEAADFNLKTSQRKNQKDFQKQPYIFRKSGKRIETLFFQLCDQFIPAYAVGVMK